MPQKWLPCLYLLLEGRYQGGFSSILLSWHRLVCGLLGAPAALSGGIGLAAPIGAFLPVLQWPHRQTHRALREAAGARGFCMHCTPVSASDNAFSETNGGQTDRLTAFGAEHYRKKELSRRLLHRERRLFLNEWSSFTEFLAAPSGQERGLTLDFSLPPLPFLFPMTAETDFSDGFYRKEWDWLLVSLSFVQACMGSFTTIE